MDASDYVRIPVDEEAERVCLGTAIVHPGWARALLQRVDVDDFYDPRHRRTLEHVVDPCTLDVEPEDGETALQARVRAVAAAADVDPRYLLSMADDFSAFGRRHLAPRLVRLAACRREMMELGRLAYNGAATSTVGDVMALADRMAELRDEIAELEAPRLTVLTGGAA